MRPLFIALAALTVIFAAAPANADGNLASVDTTMEELLGDDRANLLLASEALDLSKLGS